MTRAIALLRLDAPAKAEKDLSNLIEVKEHDVDGLYWLAIARARLGHKAEARAILAKFNDAYLPAHSKLGLAVVVAAELGEGFEGSIAALDGELANHLEYSGAVRGRPPPSRSPRRSLPTRSDLWAKSCGSRGSIAQRSR